LENILKTLEERRKDMAYVKNIIDLILEIVDANFVNQNIFKIILKTELATTYNKLDK
jgi:hypothetical protein